MLHHHQPPAPGFTGNEPFIFISYARLDKDRVYPEIERLDHEGYMIWIDKRDIPPTREWADEIQNAIKRCSFVLAFITDDALQSENVWDEIDQALKAKREILYIFLEEIEWRRIRRSAEDQQKIRKYQWLEPYRLHSAQYDQALRSTLARYVGEPQPRIVKAVMGPASLPAPAPPDGFLKTVYFALILFAVMSFLIAIVVAVTPFFVTPSPSDPLSNRLVGVLAGALFLAISVGFGIAAIAVKKKYLRRMLHD
jgi:hypothetical protein